MKRTSHITALLGCALGLSSLLGCNTGGPEASSEETTSVATPIIVQVCEPPIVSATASPGAKQPAANAIDSSPTTRWESAWADDQYIQVDLGKTLPIYAVNLYWEAAFAKTYKIEISNSATGPWTQAYPATGTGTGANGVQNLTIPNTPSARYVRMHGLTRATGYGFSLYDFTVNSSPSRAARSTSMVMDTVPRGMAAACVLRPRHLRPIATIASRP